MSINFTTQVSLTATCNTCNKQARRKETIVNGDSALAAIRFRDDLRAIGWKFTPETAFKRDKCPECNGKGDKEK